MFRSFLSPRGESSVPPRECSAVSPGWCLLDKRLQGHVHQNALGVCKKAGAHSLLGVKLWNKKLLKSDHSAADSARTSFSKQLLRDGRGPHSTLCRMKAKSHILNSSQLRSKAHFPERCLQTAYDTFMHTMHIQTVIISVFLCRENQTSWFYWNKFI